jgi:hypothetical protein
METLMLEKMVEKLTRIMKLTYPGANDLDVSENVDSKTASWLQETYTKSTRKTSDLTDMNLVAEDEEGLEVANLDPQHEEEIKVCADIWAAAATGLQRHGTV